jgi:hypothetical protein
MNLPAVLPVQDDARCLCPDCLSKVIDEALRKRSDLELQERS